VAPRAINAGASLFDIPDLTDTNGRRPSGGVARMLSAEKRIDGLTYSNFEGRFLAGGQRTRMKDEG
jgi:hypothetical protein